MNKSLRLIRIGYSFISKYIIPYFFFTLIALIIKYIETLEPIFTGRVIDYIGKGEKKLFINTLFVMFFILLGNNILSLILGWIRLRYHNKVLKKIELNYLQNYISLKKDYVLNQDKNEIKNVILDDLSAMVGFYTDSIPSLLVIFFSVGIIAYRLYCVDPRLILLTLILSVLPIMLNYLFSKTFGKINNESKIYQDEYLTVVSQYIEGKREISQNGNVNFFIKFYSNILSKGFKIIEKNAQLNNISSLLLFIINVCTNIAVFIFLGLKVIASEISVGQLISMNMLIMQFRNILINLSSAFRTIEIALVSIERVNKMTEDDDVSCWNYYSNNTVTEICLKDFSFSYNPYYNKVFDKINYSFKGPNLYLIKGDNGCGKTTLLNCIAGIFPKGCVATGNIDVISRKKPYVLFQDTSYFLFSVKDNITLGRNCNISDKENNNKILGKDISLSKGQLKRMALARMLKSDSDIYLIDEADANLDFENIELLKETIRQLAKTKLVIVITHCSYFDDIPHLDTFGDYNSL